MLKVLMAASEAVPFSKTGGLADVMGSLPKALLSQGVDVRVILPKVAVIPPLMKERMVHKCTFYVKVSWRNQYCGIEETQLDGVTYYFVDNEYYFSREALYGYTDEAERFAFFCRAVLEALPHIEFQPDILHCHDWQTGMIPVLLETQYKNKLFYENISTMFTIHNLKYQGIFPIPLFRDLFALEERYFTPDKLELNGNASFMKGGLVYSHTLTTVSDSYAKEIQYPYYGEGLEGLLQARRHSLTGILNGIDSDIYNPEDDPFIYKNFGVYTLADKVNNKLELQKELKLPSRQDVPVIGLISRLVDQKGLDLIAEVLPELLEEDIQLIVLGTGDAEYEKLFLDAAHMEPEKVSANICFDNAMAHKIYAACDLFLMPSQFEPCGLGQLISLRYGTIPIVRETGGLKDTVLSFNELTGEGNGFSFTNYDANDMLYTIKRALRFYQQKETWLGLQRAALTCDFSWERSARRYIALYSSLKG